MQAPKSLGGAGFIPLEAAAGSSQTINFLKHWRTPSQQVGKLLHITVAHSQFYAGISTSIMEFPEINILIPFGFIQAVRSYLTKINAKILLEKPYIQLPLRAKDESIMDIAMTLNFSPNQLEKVNCVRIYLGFFYISELCNPEGTEISQSILQQKRCHQIREFISTWNK